MPGRRGRSHQEAWIPGLPVVAEGDGAGLAAFQRLEELRGDPDSLDRLMAAQDARKMELQGMSLRELADELGGRGELQDDDEEQE